MAIWNIVAGLGISFGARLLGGLFGGGGTQTTSQMNEQGFVNDFAQPTSQYGQHIPRTWGNVRVTGNMLWAELPPQERVDQWDTEQTSGGTRTITTNRQAYYYGWAVYLFARVNPDATIRKLWLNEKLVYEWGQVAPEFGPKYFTDPNLPLNAGNQISTGLEFTHYRGDELLGGIVPDVDYSWRQRSIVELKELYLGEFGNSYPSASAEIHQGDPIPLINIIADLLEGAGYEETEYDLAELIGMNVRGFKTTSADSVESYLRQLQQAYFIEYYEAQGKLKFIRMLRPGVVASIPLTDMGAHEAGGEVPDKIEVEITPEYDLPSQVELNFNTITEVWYETRTVQSERIREDYENILTVNLDITLTDSEAKAIANKLLQVAWTQRKKYRFSVQPKYSHLEPGDVVQISLGWESVPVQIVRTDQGANGLIKIEARGYSATALGGTPPGGTPNPGEPTPEDPGTIPAIVPTTVTLQELTGNGVAAFISADPGWRSAQLSYSRDGGTTYLPFSSTQTLSTPDGSGGFLLTGYYGRLNIFPSDIGQTIYVKAVSFGQTIDDAVAASIVISGIGLAGQITGFSPTQGDEGTEITIVGFGFATATAGTINGTALTSFTVVSDTEITAIVGTGTTTGKIEITTSAGTIQSATDFVIVASSVEWGQITGTLANQTDLQDVLVRTRVLTFITNTVNIPGVGNTVNVQIEDNYGLVPGIPLCLFSLNPANGANNYAQVWCTAVSVDGLTLTVEIQAIGRIACYEFVPGDVIAVITEATVGIYGGLMPPLQNGDWKKNYGSAFIASPTVSIIPLFTAPIYTVIKQIRGLRLSAGTATLSIQIDGVSVTGLNNIAVTTTAQTINATALDVAEVGDRVTVNITAVSSAANLEFTLMAEVG